MRIIIVQVGDIYKFPPVLSLINALEDMNIETYVISSFPSGNYKKDFTRVIFDPIEISYEKIKSPYKKLLLMPTIKKEMWKKIDGVYNKDSVIWVVTDITIKFLGKQLLQKRYVLHLMELSEKLILYKKMPFLKLNEHVYGNAAMAIIVPEYNRAHILAAWWRLKQMPLILPNKPFYSQQYAKYGIVEDEEANKVLAKIGNKKIILYQGIISEERPLDNIIRAVDCFDGKYAFVVMSGNEDRYQYLGSPNYYYIPYVRAPKHLQITSHAYIGVLSYVPTYNTGYSPLNSLYCAPNKTFEFSMFGIPMLGNNIPGLRYLFETEKIGCCFEEFTSEDIVKAIEKIERDYDTFSINSRKYYRNCDYVELLTDVLDKLNRLL